MRVWLLAFALLASAGGVACTKATEEPKKQPPATTSTGTVAADGVRTVPIEADKNGFVPERIPGKPGEKLKLAITRRSSGGSCMSQLKTPEGKIVDLPLDKPYEVAVTVPNDGEVKFACGMEMFFGVVVAEKG
jgi:plastocyanin domain-containing protein